MKVIIAGSRKVKQLSFVEQAVAKSGFDITEVVSGKEPTGVDKLGEIWAKHNGIPIKPFRARWDDLSFPDALIKVNRWGKEYDALAGFRRNHLMSVYADALIAIWYKESSGTLDMLERMEARRKPYYLAVIKDAGTSFSIDELIWLDKSERSRTVWKVA